KSFKSASHKDPSNVLSIHFLYHSDTSMRRKDAWRLKLYTAFSRIPKRTNQTTHLSRAQLVPFKTTSSTGCWAEFSIEPHRMATFQLCVCRTALNRRMPHAANL